MPSLSWYKPALARCMKAGYSRGDFVQDLFAGLLVGVVALPLSMGLAIASGCKPEQGLFTAIIGGLVVSLLGGSRVQIAGPAGAFVGLCAGGVNQFGYEGLAFAGLMAGALMVLMGANRLGRAISFIPIPVVIGFTTGIAVIIASTQLAPSLGIVEPATPFAFFHERIHFLWMHVQEINPAAVGICAATAAIIVITRKLSPRAPGALIALILVGTATWVLDLRVETILQSRFHGIPSSLPMPHLPSLGLHDGYTVSDVLRRLMDLSSLALGIALLASIESLLSAVVADGLAGDRHDSNTELVGQGMANLLSPLFGGLPVSGVIARTSTNIRAGARTPVAGIVHALTVVTAILFAAPLVGHAPLAALAGVLLVVCWSMAELRHWPYILKAGRSDAFLLPLAFTLTVFLDLRYAVVIGVLLGMLFFVKRMADMTQLEQRVPDHGTSIHLRAPEGVEVFEINGPFFFGAATLIRDLDHQLSRKPRAMILRLRHVPFIDATAAYALRELLGSCRARGTLFMMCELGRVPRADLERHGLAGLIGAGGIHEHLADAFNAVPAAGEDPFPS